jgi:hypothetical protein
VKTVQFGAMNGVRNDVSLERFKLGDLSVGVNVDIDETGKVFRREGTTPVVAGNMHSLYSDGKTTLVVDSGALTALDTVWGKHPIKSVAGRMLDYVTINNEVYWSDEFEAGIIQNGENRRWGIAVPPAPHLSEIAGDLDAGTYLFTTTYLRRDGRESGAPQSVGITVAANSGVQITLTPSADSLVIAQRLYVTSINGEVPYLVGEVNNGVTTLTLSDLPNLGTAVRTQFMGPAPSGQVVGYFAGRAYVAQGPYLWYSAPFEYELFDLRSGYIGFDANVTTFAPVSDGIYVGSEKSVFWLQGTDPTAFERLQVANYGAVRGTERDIPPHYFGEGAETGVIQTFMTTSGMCVGLEHGVFKNLTGDRYIPIAASAGASLLKIRSGTPLLTTTLFKD